MDEQTVDMKPENIRLTAIVTTAGVILLIPYVAMKFTGEVKWGPLDFLVAGVLLLATGLAIELVLRMVKKVQYRVAICAAILLALFVIWAELAVGLIGTPLAGS